MIRRPIHLSCDSCGVGRAPTSRPGEDKPETLANAFREARSEGWVVRYNGAVIYCPTCHSGKPVPRAVVHQEIHSGKIDVVSLG